MGNARLKAACQSVIGWQTRKDKMSKRVELLRHALSENGIVCFNTIDQPLVTELCEIIGVLHRKLEFGPTGYLPSDIEEAVAESEVCK